MKILYHCTNLPPRIPDTEASLQEINWLRAHFGGKLVYLNPNQQSPIYLPRLFFGFHQLRQIRAEESHLSGHHLFNADPFPFPFLRWLRRPVIYSISSGVSLKQPCLSFFNNLAAITVSDERSLNRLQAWGLNNIFLVRPGIEADRFTCTPRPLRSELWLLFASAPWTKAQFRSKGIDALLEAIRQRPQVRLICVWRGVLVNEIKRRVQRLGLTDRVEIINRRVTMNDILAGVHATINLATDPAIIRSYPHSLMESLAAGKPVIVSRSIPMADYVDRTGCGKVVEQLTPTDILMAIEALVGEYEALEMAARQVGQRDFSRQALVESYQQVYEQVFGG